MKELLQLGKQTGTLMSKHCLETYIFKAKFYLAYLDVVRTQDDPTTEHEPSVNGQGAHHEAKHIGEGCLQGQDQDLSTGTKTFFAFSKSQNRKQRARC